MEIENLNSQLFYIMLGGISQNVITIYFDDFFNFYYVLFVLFGFVSIIIFVLYTQTKTGGEKYGNRRS